MLQCISVKIACVRVQGVYVFYLQLLTDMLHLCVYLVFFVIVFTNYGLPLHLVSTTFIFILLLLLQKYAVICILHPPCTCAGRGYCHTISVLVLSLPCKLGPLQVRDLYWTFRNFKNRVTDFLRYR